MLVSWRSWSISACVAVAAVGLSAPAFAGGIEGTWDTPWGEVRIEENQFGFVGALVDPGDNCPGLAKGETVLRGRVVDDMFTGQVRVCGRVRCGKDDWALALATSVNGGLAGAASLNGCESLALKSGAFVLSRSKKKPDPAPDRKEPKFVAAPKKTEAQVLLAEAKQYLANGLFERAQVRLQKAEQLEPKNPEILNDIGVTFAVRYDNRRAEAYYRKALASDPSFYDAHYNLASIYAREKRVKEACNALRSAIDYGFKDGSLLDQDKDFDPVRDDPEFKKVVKLVESKARGR